PAAPKIFYGRDTEVCEIVKMFTHESPRIALLGGGGMGKTTLAKTILHHPAVLARFGPHRFFVECDIAAANISLSDILLGHLCLEDTQDSTRMVLKFFRTAAPCLLVLDNLESVWEEPGVREETEKVLALLTEVEHLALIITLRGAEHPAMVRWTRPFLKPLGPLPQDAARQIFLDITDEHLDPSDIDKALALTGNIPLVIDLVSHLVESEGLDSVLIRWDMEATSLVSKGHTHTSNVDLSISLSLSGPRIESLPQARELLAVFSLLPDGLSDVDLQQSGIPIAEILGCKTALLRTSLAYMDEHRKLRVLAPIREHMSRHYPPSSTLIQPLLLYFEQLLQTYRRYIGTISNTGLLGRIKANAANIENILRHGLHSDNPNLVQTIQCTFTFTGFGRVTNHGTTLLIDRVAQLLSDTNHYALKLGLITENLRLLDDRPIINLQNLISEGLDYCGHLDPPSRACKLLLLLTNRTHNYL
ncbi:hypothetical protein C8R46DRAFT_882956, partial [Mycena filopes]